MWTTDTHLSTIEISAHLVEIWRKYSNFSLSSEFLDTLYFKTEKVLSNKHSVLSPDFTSRAESVSWRNLLSNFLSMNDSFNIINLFLFLVWLRIKKNTISASIHMTWQVYSPFFIEWIVIKLNTSYVLI